MQALRRLFRKSSRVRKFIGYHVASLAIFDSYFRNYRLDASWQARVNDVLACGDLAKIEKVPNAGEIRHGKQLMHNGLWVYNGSYYGPEYAQLLNLCQGVHEPQEEYVFQEVLKLMRSNAVMIEMGAFWSFYSMWFQQRVIGAVNFMIEPEEFNLGHGQRNFKLNNFKGHFTRAFVSKESSAGNPPTVSVDSFVTDNKIDFVDLLHSDIQGFEYEMLQGASRLISEQRVGYIFISTHNDQVHGECEKFLLDAGFVMIASANMAQTYSVDGLIVARSPKYDGIGPLDICCKQI